MTKKQRKYFENKCISAPIIAYESRIRNSYYFETFRVRIRVWIRERVRIKVRIRVRVRVKFKIQKNTKLQSIKIVTLPET
jgi:hypothetical protein